VGTNLGLSEFLMTVMAGHFRESGGCVFPALTRVGYGPRESRRVWRAAAMGSWKCNCLLARLRACIDADAEWEPLRVEGRQVVALDTTGIFRPRLKNLVSRHFAPAEHKTAPAICLGLMAAMGRVGEQHVAVPMLIARGPSDVSPEDSLMVDLIRQAGERAVKDWVFCADRKFLAMVMVRHGLTQIVKRVQKNAIFRREVPESQIGRGRRRLRGQVVRPLTRRVRGKVIDGSPPDEQASWQELEQGELVKITTSIWRRLHLREQRSWDDETRALSDKTLWTVYAIHHPSFDEPMLVITNAEFTPRQAYQIAHGRWGVEQPPLVTKQLLGLHRQNVWSGEMRYRLPELGFIGAGILTYVAACHKAVPTGWWDTRAKPTAGRLRQQLAVLRRDQFRQLLCGDQLREKKSTTAHLPVGNRYPRRPVQPIPMRN
jgi:hypothetical protein